MSEGKITDMCACWLVQTEACLISRPLTADSDDGAECLAPGHFLIGHPLEAIPDSSFTHFWQRCSTEYLTGLQRMNKWRSPSKAISVGNVVILCEDTIGPTQWPLAQVVQTHPGKDGIVQVVTV